MEMLRRCPHSRLAELAADEEFLGRVHEQATGLAAYLSGGLGVLAGDHLKSASDLGVPLIGVGLLYTYGYFTQSLSADGWQEEEYIAHSPKSLPVEKVRDENGEQIVVEVAFPENRTVAVALWVAQGGRVPLLLLDTNIDRNP